MATKITIFLLLAVHTSYAQQGVFTLRPALGLQTVLNKQIQNGYTKAFLKNNVFEEEIYYGIGLEYETKKQRIFSLQYMNGNSGYSIKITPKPCNNAYNGGYTGKEKASSHFNNRRILAGFQFPIIKYLPYKKKNFAASVKLGFGADFKGIETDESGFIAIGTNLCGEKYYLDEVVKFRNSRISYMLPFQFNLDWYHRNKKRLQLSFFVHLGLSTNVIFDIDYVNITRGTREKSIFLSRGSGYGAILSYPIKVYRYKKKK
jgi:hypothetical protein